jgi:hypothetical protein
MSYFATFLLALLLASIVGAGLGLWRAYEDVRNSVERCE